MSSVQESFLKLKSYCEHEGFLGWDPYDGLNSKVFDTLPFKHWDIARLIWIQAFKRSRVNLRHFMLVPKQYNAKGIGLFLTGYCNLHKLSIAGDTRFGTSVEIENRIIELSELLLGLQSKGYSGACWGYGFDWQSRAFFLPKHTPTVVATSFAVEALLSAYEVTGNLNYLTTALSSSDFVLNDLNRIHKEDDLFMFSYSPLDHQAVYNATLLGTKILSLIYSHTGNVTLKNASYKSAKAVCRKQNPDGSFPHSDQVGQSWRDSFHTAFKLESLMAYQMLCGDNSFSQNIESGFAYWIDNYFDSSTGFSYYYDKGSSRDLVDLHCAAQALSTFYKLGTSGFNWDFIERVATWSIMNMQDNSGYFYFQKNRAGINKIAYMRWPNAWMFYGLSYWLLMAAENGKS